MTEIKYFVGHRNGKVVWVRVCYTEEQVNYYQQFYEEHGEEFSVELENPLKA